MRKIYFSFILMGMACVAGASEKNTLMDNFVEKLKEPVHIQVTIVITIGQQLL